MKLKSPMRVNKNKTIPALAGVCFCLAVAAVPVMAGNVLSNPGFESDPPGQSQNLVGWTWYGQSWGNTFNETGPAAHGGSNYFKVFQGFTGSVNYNGIYQDYVSGPGAAYVADGWAETISSDTIAGQNVAWLEVTFRDAGANVLALYRSSLISTNTILAGAFPVNAWDDLRVTNQYDPNTYVITNTASLLVAPPGTYFVRYQVVFQGDAAGSNGSVYFDDLDLNLTSAAPYGDWNIVWSDEFNGAAIDTNTWTFDNGNGGSNPGWGNNELEYYTSRTNNAYVAGGLLHIVARQESTNNFSFTSARMKTQGLVAWQYGRFEWRASLPAGVGFWPALWFLGTNITSVGWPGCGEMDVVENNGSALTNVQGSLHSGSDETAIYTFPAGGSVTGFHNYVLDWSSNSFLFYVDGHLYENQTGWSSSLGAAYPAPFNQPCFMLLNLAVGGNYTGNPSLATINANGGFPGELQVDYVRVYNLTPPLKISLTRTNNAFLVSWPSNVVGHLQAQLNPPGGLGSNWTDQTQYSNPAQLNPTNRSGFYRVASP
jgi:beta-glucanase (GH16 family)